MKAILTILILSFIFRGFQTAFAQEIAKSSPFEDYKVAVLTYDSQIKLKAFFENDTPTVRDQTFEAIVQEIDRVVNLSEEDFQKYMESQDGYRKKWLSRMTSKTKTELRYGARKYGYGFAAGLILGEIVEYGLPPILIFVGLPQFAPFVLFIPQGTVFGSIGILANSIRTYINQVKAFKTRSDYLAWKRQKRAALKKLKLKNSNNVVYEMSDDTYSLRSADAYFFSDIVRWVGFEKSKIHIRSAKKFARSEGIDRKLIKKIKDLDGLTKPLKAALLLEITKRHGKPGVETRIEERFKNYVFKHEVFNLEENEISYQDWINTVSKVSTQTDFEKFCYSTPLSAPKSLILTLWNTVIRNTLIENLTGLSVGEFRRWGRFLERETLASLKDENTSWNETDRIKFCEESLQILY